MTSFHIRFRDHGFDLAEPKKNRQNPKYKTVSNPEAPGRGGRSVRQHYHVDETKMLDSKRFNIQLKS